MGVEGAESAHGKGLKWRFKVTKGAHAGAEATGFTQGTPTPQNKCGRFLAGVTRKALALNEQVDLGKFVGQSYLIVVEPTAQGGSKVATVSALPKH